MRILWVTGAPNAGKSVATWALFQELSNEGADVAYVDIDQLGMVFPAPPDDEYRHRVKLEALAALLPGYRTVGVELLLVSGVTGDETSREDLHGIAEHVIVCALRPGRETLSRRLRASGMEKNEIARALAADAGLERTDRVDVSIANEHLSVAQTVVRLRGLLSASRAVAGDVLVSQPIPAESIRVAVITGTRAVGTSSIGFRLALDRWGCGLRTAFLDAGQLSFVFADHIRYDAGRFAAQQIDALAGVFARDGAGSLIVAAHWGSDEVRRLRTLLELPSPDIVRLLADKRSLTERVARRSARVTANLAGEDLLGLTPDRQAAVVTQALADQNMAGVEFEPDVIAIDTSGQVIDDVLGQVARLLKI